jgi:hypothetical protein
MDVSELLSPGVQNLLSEILLETWSTVRGALSRRLSRGGTEDSDRIPTELDVVRAKALSAAKDRAEAEAFLAGYLYGLQQRHPGLEQAAIGATADVHTSGQNSTVSSGDGITLVVHRDVGSAVTVSEMSGDININGRP